MKYQIVKAYWPSLRKYWISLVITFITMAIAIGLTAISPYYLRGIVDTFTSNSPDVELARHLLFKMFLVVVGINVARRVFDVSITLHESRTMKDLDLNSFRHIQRQSMGFFENTYSGSLVTQARRFRSSYERIMDLFFFQFGSNIVMFCAILVAFVSAIPALALPFIAWVVVFVVYSVGTTLWKYPYNLAAADKDSRVGAALADSLTNHLAVKTFGGEVFEEERFGVVVQEAHSARLHSWMRTNVIMVGQWLIMCSGELAFVWWMITGWEKGVVTAGTFVFAQTFIVWAISRITGFGQSLRLLFSAIAEAEEMAEVYALNPEVQDAPGARAMIIEAGEVEFHAVSFSYGGISSATVKAVFDMTINIPSGQSVGLVGKSGAGKSTLVRLLLRFYDVDSGYIRIDGQYITNVTQMSLRQQLAVVPQHPQLFHRSIRDNIAFARPDASEDEIVYAAEQAQAWEFIEGLSDGLDTLVGERGIKLSGGQQQRIAIARAILADPRILILDEATSSLDSETEKLIQKAITNLLEDRTAIVIAHRLSTIMQLDRIVVMDEGRIIEDGTHGHLLGLDGTYANLWAHQSGGYIN